VREREEQQPLECSEDLIREAVIKRGMGVVVVIGWLVLSGTVNDEAGLTRRSASVCLFRFLYANVWNMDVPLPCLV